MESTKTARVFLPVFVGLMVRHCECSFSINLSICPGVRRCCSFSARYNEAFALGGQQFPDERTQRAALEAAFRQIDANSDASLDINELREAGFDVELILEKLDSDRDGRLSRDEFVDRMVALTTEELVLSAWELADRKEAEELSSPLSSRADAGTPALWGSQTVRRAIAQPKFELISLVAVLTASLCYAVGTLNSLDVAQRLRLAQVEDVTSVAFAVEYVLQWWGRSFSTRFLVEPSALVDLLSFAPLLIHFVIPVLLGGFRDAVHAIDAYYPSITPLLDMVSPEIYSDARLQTDDFAFLRLLRVLRLQRYVKDMRSFRRFEAALGFNPLMIKPYQLEVHHSLHVMRCFHMASV